jgi:hypothetical protein
MEAQEKQVALLPQKDESQMLVFGSKNNFEDAMRMAKCLSASTIVPASYQGDKGMPNCIIALEMANRIGASPLMVMQNLYIVHGNPGWSAKFLIAALNSSGKFSPLRYEFSGKEGADEWACRAYATDKTGEVLHGAWVSIGMAKKEGWYDKSGSKWKTMPQLMLQYRAAAFFQRTYAPEISMGMHTEDELRDISVEVPYEDVSEAVEREKAENANKTVIELDVAAPDGDKSAAVKVDAKTGEVTPLPPQAPQPSPKESAHVEEKKVKEKKIPF